MAATRLCVDWEPKGVQLELILVQGGGINIHVKVLAEFLCHRASS